MYDLIIIGGGPAGMTAGIYAARQKLNTILITKSFGGQMARKVVDIKNYPGFERVSGLELIEKMEKQLRNQKIEIELGEVVKLEKTDNKFSVLTKDKKKFESKTVIVTSGNDPRPLEIPGEKEYIGRGVSYCTTCDGPLFSNKAVAVVGGGNSGFESAIFLSKIAKEIYILEYGEKPKADAENQEKAAKIKNIKIITNAVLKKIEGNKFVNALSYQDRVTGNNFAMAVQGVFVEIGSQPATSFLKDMVDFSERDEIKVDFETFQTRTPGLFAAGDVNMGKYKQVVTACGEGAKAALAAYDYIQKSAG